MTGSMGIGYYDPPMPKGGFVKSTMKVGASE